MNQTHLLLLPKSRWGGNKGDRKALETGEHSIGIQGWRKHGGADQGDLEGQAYESHFFLKATERLYPEICVSEHVAIS